MTLTKNRSKRAAIPRQAVRLPTSSWGIALLIIVLLLLIAYPIGWLVATAFGAPKGFDFSAFISVFSSESLLTTISNTLILGISCAFGAVVLGVPLAWYTAVTDGPFRKTIHTAVIATYVTPPYLTAIAFTLLLSPQAGVMNTAIKSVGLPAFNIYSMAGLVLVISLHVCSFCYLMVHDAFKRIDGPLIEAAQTLQASRMSVIRRIVLPLVAPSITGGALLAGIIAMTEFGPQAVLGGPAALTFLPTRIVSSLGGYPPRWDEMAVLALILVLFAIIGLYVQRRVLSKQSFITVSGKGITPMRVDLGKARWPAATLAILFAVVATVLPFAVLVSGAFAIQPTELLSLSNFTLENFAAAFIDDPVTARAVANSAGLAVAAATICVVIGLTIAYVSARTTSKSRNMPDYIAALPLGLPATVIGFGLLLAVINPPFRSLYATSAVLLLLYIVRFLPLATRALNSGLSQLSPDLEAAARISGASWFTAIRRISLPLLAPTIVAAWLLVLMPSMNELGGTIVLYSSGNETISIAIMRLNDLGQFGPVAALAVTIIGALLIVSNFANRLSSGGEERAQRKAARKESK